MISRCVASGAQLAFVLKGLKALCPEISDADGDLGSSKFRVQ